MDKTYTAFYIGTGSSDRSSGCFICSSPYDRKNGVKKDRIDTEHIAVNEEVKEKIQEEENGEGEETKTYTGVYNIAFLE